MVKADVLRFTALSWRLIEWKLMYYKPEAVHRSRRKALTISDDDYDAAEQEYLHLCRQLKQPNTLVHKVYPGFDDVGTKYAMMEIDVARPSVQLVMKKLGSKKK